MRALFLWLAVGLIVFGLAFWRARHAARKAQALRASREAIAAATLAAARADAQRRSIENATRAAAQREARRVEAEEAARMRAIRQARLERERRERDARPHEEAGADAGPVEPPRTFHVVDDAAAQEEARRLATNQPAQTEARRAADEANRRAAQTLAQQAADRAARETALREAEARALEEARREAELARARREAARQEAQARAAAQAAQEAQAAREARREAEARAAEEAAQNAAQEAARQAAEEAAREAAEQARREAEQARALREAALDLPPPAPKAPAETLILVADDSKVVRIKAGKLLQGHGYRVALAVDGLDAIRLAQEELPDLVVTDVEMPHLDGFGLARHLKGDPRTAHVPIVMITSADAAHRESAQAAGVGLVLGKPFPEAPLLEHIRSFRFAAPPADRGPGFASTQAGAFA